MSDLLAKLEKQKAELHKLKSSGLYRRLLTSNRNMLDQNRLDKIRTRMKACQNRINVLRLEIAKQKKEPVHKPQIKRIYKKEPQPVKVELKPEEVMELPMPDDTLAELDPLDDIDLELDNIN